MKISENLARTFRAMMWAAPNADPVVRGRAWMSSSEIARETGSVERSTCYHQIKRLVAEGLVEESLITTPALYRVRDDLSPALQAKAGFIIQAYDVYEGR